MLRPPPPQPHVQALCSLSFDEGQDAPDPRGQRSQGLPGRCCSRSAEQADAKAVIVGESTPRRRPRPKEQKFAAKHKHAKVEDLPPQRAVNAKEYLVTEKGIDPSRVSVATGTTDGQTVEDYLVPAGANFSADVQGTTPVDESTVKPEARKPLAQRHHHKAVSVPITAGLETTAP